MAIALPFILQLLQSAPSVITALMPLIHRGGATVVDSSGAAVSASVLKDLQDAAAAATASAVTGVQAAG
jgi:hypothetical protein